MRKRALFVGAVTGVLLLGGGVAYASIPASDGTINGCYDSHGKLSVIDSAASCPSGSTALNWSQTGPAGPSTAGSAGLDTTIVRQVFDNTQSGSVTCPDDHPYALGGGGSTAGVPMSASVPVGTTGSHATGWSVQTQSGVNVNGLQVFAICAK